MATPCKLTQDDKEVVRELLAEDHTVEAIAKRFGVARHTIDRFISQDFANLHIWLPACVASIGINKTQAVCVIWYPNELPYIEAQHDRNEQQPTER